MSFIEFDENVWQNQEKLLAFFSKRYCIGTDEVGRGCLAGPVVAASVLLPDNASFFVTDSKKLNKIKREMISKEILSRSPFVGISFIHVEVIDKVNILNATKLAMKNSISRCLNNIKNTILKQDLLLCIDGNFSLPGIEELSQVSVIKGDNAIASISAASIVAKVVRDAYMVSMSRIYPFYGFEQHKGYGTELHRKKILQHGLCRLHRKSFCKRIADASYQ